MQNRSLKGESFARRFKPVKTGGLTGFATIDRIRVTPIFGAQMATISPGSGGTFTSTTAEQRCLEALAFLHRAERDATLTNTTTRAIAGSFSLDTLTFTGTYSIPCAQTIAATGGLAITAIPYLSGVVFNPGTGEKTLNSTAIEAYCLEALQYLQWLESQSSRNPQSRNYVSGSFNAENGLYSGTFSIPITFTFDAAVGGGINFDAAPYLT